MRPPKREGARLEFNCLVVFAYSAGPLQTGAPDIHTHTHTLTHTHTHTHVIEHNCGKASQSINQSILMFLWVWCLWAITYNHILAASPIELWLKIAHVALTFSKAAVLFVFFNAFLLLQSIFSIQWSMKEYTFVGAHVLAFATSIFAALIAWSHYCSTLMNPDH